MTLIDESSVLDRAVGRTWPGARAFVDVRGWGDPAPMYTIHFRNGVQFTDTTQQGAVRAAETYAEATFKLTGEYP